MAGPSLHGDSPQGRESADTNGAFTVFAIVILLAVGLALRFIIAQLLLPGSGFPTDLGAFQSWANDIAQNGPIGFYTRQSFIDYPPVYLMLLAAVSFLMGGNIGDGVKLLPILADLGLAVVVWRLVLDLGLNSRRALLAAAIVLLNPITWFNSAIWGQADSVGSIFLLLGLRELMKDRRESASALAVLAVLTKMQLGILGFLVAFVILRRSLLPKTGQPEPERILSSLGAGLVTAALICLPFTGIDLAGIAQRLSTAPGLLTAAAGLVAGAGVFALGRLYLPVADAARRTQVSVLIGAATAVAFAGMVFDAIATHLGATFGEYPYLTLNAYNPWALMADQTGAMDTTKSWLHDVPWSDAASKTSGTGYVIGPFPTTIVVMVLAAAVVLVVAAIAGWWYERAAVSAAPESVPASSPVDAAWAPATTPHAGGSAVARTLRDALAEAAGLWGAALVLALVISTVVLAAVGGKLYAALLGDGLLLATLLGVGAWAAWRDDRQSLLVALTILSIAFFVEPTRAHERYLFPFFALGAVLLAGSWRWSIAYVLLSIANAANLVAVLVQYNGIPEGDGSLAKNLIDIGNGVLSTTTRDGLIWPIAACGVVTGVVMVWSLLQLRPRAAAALAREVEAGTDEPGAPAFWAGLFSDEDRFADHMPAAGPGSVPAAALAAPLDATEAPVAATGPADDYADWPDDDEDYSYDAYDPYDPDRPKLVPGAVMRLWYRIARPSTHPDRSPALNVAPRGRLTKLDIWVVVALVVGLLSIRVFRLDEPLQMHFDEVYHARTATEFLQEWRYGEPHNIYEWTHPHLAKYAIAAGITLFSDDKVISTSDLGVPVKDALVQPRTAASPLDTSSDANANANLSARYGDRVFVATGTSVRVYDLESTALVKTYAIPGVSALALDASAGKVYAGTSGGRIYVIDTNSLDKVQNGSAAAATDALDLGVETGLDISRLYAGSDPFVLATDAAGSVVSVDTSLNGGAVIARATIDGIADFADLGTGPTTLLKNPSQTETSSASPASSASPSASPASSASQSPSQSASPGSTAADAEALASALKLDTSDVQAALDAAASAGVPQELALGTITPDQVTAVQALITDGTLPDISVGASTPQILIAYHDGVALLDPRTLAVTSTISTDAPATSLGVNYSDFVGTGIRAPCDLGGGQPSLVTAGDYLVPFNIDQRTTPWTISQCGNAPLKMPGAVTQILMDRATRVAHVLGRTPDGAGWTMYAIETNGDTVFSDARLPFKPVAVSLDSSPNIYGDNHEQILAFSPSGATSVVDVGQFAFSWRIIGVLFGVLMAACLYLLVRLLFRRRSVALLVALFSMTDGMLFVQSRIAMNDTYVGGFLLLAYLIFALMWLKVSKSEAVNWALFWLGMPVMGVVLGLALASKWVALYAIASIAMLILIRSALGRVVSVVGLAMGTGVLGWQAIAEMTTEPNTGSPAGVVVFIGLGLTVFVGGLLWASSMRAKADKAFLGVVTLVVAAGLFGAALTMSPMTIQSGAPNYTYFLIMLLATAIAAAANAYHPIAWTREETRFAILGPISVGLLALLLGVLRNSHLIIEVGAAGLGLGVFAAVVFWGAGRLGFGPWAPVPGPDDPASYAGPAAPAPTGWLRLGSGFGLPAVWMAACVLILPISVYVAMYIPWAMPWQPETPAATQMYGGAMPVLFCPDADSNGYCPNGDGWPNGHTGQTLIQQTIGMYNYHNDLRSPHPASSPWWAWPMDLKPVWFENASFAGDDATMIFDGGNPALWWIAIFGMAFVGWQAFKRRSLALSLVAMAFFWQWLSWARIDRAAFEYHFYTALPFFLVALAYFLAELWHGPSRRTWLLARFAGGAALIFPAFAWILKGPLCTIARVDAADNAFKGTICGATTGDVVIEARILEIAIVLVLAFIALGLILVRLERRQSSGREDKFWIVQLLIPVGIAVVALWWLGLNGSHDTVFQAALPSDALALVLLPVLAILAFVAFTARNPRRFVLGACAFVVVVGFAFYPDWSALPLPNAIINVYQGLLPTWFYGFEFSVNLQAAAHVNLISPWSITLGLLALLVAGVTAWAAWERRVVIGFRRSRRFASEASASASAPATSGDAAADATGDDMVDPGTSRKDKPQN